MYRENLPNSLLRTIVDRVATDLTAAKKAEPIAELKARVKDCPPTRDFAAALSQGFGLIAEIKKKSPSMGTMKHTDTAAIARIYGASRAVKAVSVLTNLADFGMGIDELARVRALIPQPILRKDFIFDPYQLWQARAYGADAILLMANVVTRGGLEELLSLADSLGLGVLFEAHEENEIRKIPAGAKICGINSRRFMAGKGKSTRMAYWITRMLRIVGGRRDRSINQKQFELVMKLPKNSIKVAESGVDPSMVAYLRDTLHFDSMLVGTSILMSENGVAAALNDFEQEICPCRTADVSTGALHHAAA